MNKVNVERTVDLVNNRLVNNGYFSPKVIGEIQQKKKGKEH